MFASVEANKPECIKILHEYGITVNGQYTDRENAILAGATPLHLAAYYGRIEAGQAILLCGGDVNAVDLVNKQTPLHVAVIQGNLPFITLLRNANADVNLVDAAGNVAASYCRSPEIRELLINPALGFKYLRFTIFLSQKKGILFDLARGCFPKEELVQACTVVERYSGVVGCLSPAQALDVTSVDGTTPMMQAIMHSNWPVAKLLRDIGCDCKKKNTKNVSCAMYAHWINHARIKGFVELTATESEELQAIRRLNGASKVLFLGPAPSRDCGAIVSSIGNFFLLLS